LAIGRAERGNPDKQEGNQYFSVHKLRLELAA
jgi:hypothetical protein